MKHNPQCNCFDCQTIRKHGSFENIPDTIPIPGELRQFGCKHCAGTGYLDYPSCKRPCPIEGHKGTADLEQRITIVAMREVYKNNPQPRNCPYCKQNPCEHWTGLGWVNPQFKKGETEQDN